MSDLIAEWENPEPSKLADLMVHLSQPRWGDRVYVGDDLNLGLRRCFHHKHPDAWATREYKTSTLGLFSGAEEMFLSPDWTKHFLKDKNAPRRSLVYAIRHSSDRFRMRLERMQFGPTPTLYTLAPDLTLMVFERP